MASEASNFYFLGFIHTLSLSLLLSLFISLLLSFARALSLTHTHNPYSLSFGLSAKLPLAYSKSITGFVKKILYTVSSQCLLHRTPL